MTGTAVLFTQGLAAHQAGRLDEAEGLYRRVLQADPRHAEALRLLGLIALVSGQTEAAATLISESARLAPGSPETEAQLGLALKAAGRIEEAVLHLEAARDLAPDDASILTNLTAALRAAGRLANAGTRARQSVALAPDLAEALLNLGNLGHGSAIRRALRVRPTYFEAWINLANELARAKNVEGSLGAYHQALGLRPQSPEVLTNLGALLFELDKIEAARLCHRKAAALTPGDGGALGNLGLVMKASGGVGEGIAWQRRALAIRDDAGSWNSLGDSLQAAGDVPAALVAYRRSVALGGSAAWHSNLLFCLCYDAAITSDALFDEVRAWVARHAPKSQSKPLRRAITGKPKVGVLSSDLRDHPVGRTILGFFEHHQRVALHGYAEVAREDATTAKFRSHSEGWTSTVGLGDEDIAARMRKDGLDLLLVLAGNTARNRPLVAAFGGAPVQASYADLTTSGLEAMDWCFTDGVLHPEGTRERFTEKLWRVRHCYPQRPPEEAPAVGPLPSDAKGRITFVSCNNPAKLTDAVVSLWSRVLKAVPHSQLLLKYVGWFGDRTVRERFIRMFEANGVGADRLDFRGRDLRRIDQLALLNEADIALDPFPFNGCTTTFEALWMGVPVVTLAGERWLGRMGTGMLTSLGLPELVASDEEGYVAAAAQLADDRRRMAELRRTLRPRLVASPVCDAAGHASDLEDAILRMTG